MVKTIYLVRHSIKDKAFVGKFDSQKNNELIPLSEKGKELAVVLSNINEFNNVDVVYSSNYERAYETAKYIADKNNLEVIRDSSFDERHYGDKDITIDKEYFWIEQFKNNDLKFENGESQKDVQLRMNDKIEKILKSNNKKIIVVGHNASILFYLLKYCKLESAIIPKKIKISYKGNLVLDDKIMKSPSYFKLTFDDSKLVDIEYFEI